MENLIPYLKYGTKGVLAFVGAFCASAATGSLDGHLSQPEVWTGLSVATAATAAVFGFKNGPKPTK